MNVTKQKMELNKKDIYDNVRRDINRKQAVHSSKSAEMPDRSKKVYSRYDHYYYDLEDALTQPSFLYQKSVAIPQHQAQLQSLTNKAEDEGRERDDAERDDETEKHQEEPPTGRLRSKRSEHEAQD